MGNESLEATSPRENLGRLAGNCNGEKKKSRTRMWAISGAMAMETILDPGPRGYVASTKKDPQKKRRGQQLSNRERVRGVSNEVMTDAEGIDGGGLGWEKKL